MKSKKIKISNMLLSILVLIAIVLIVLIGKEYSEREKNEEKLQEVLSEVTESTQTNESDEIQYIKYEGYQVIGTIQIESINLEYPILIESTEDALKKSISRYGNGKVNEIGNLCLAGHNYTNGTMFGKINQLESGDEISIMDLYGNEVTYVVFDKYITDSNDSGIQEPIDENRREVTLITCINGNKNRLIIRASEK